MHAQRLVRRRDVHLDVAEGAPVQRLKAAMLTSVGKEDVPHTPDRPPCYRVAVSLLSVRVDQCLGVRETHRGPSPAARLEDRVRIGRV